MTNPLERPVPVSSNHEERPGLNTQQLSALAVHALEELKGQNIVCLNVQKLTPMADYMVIVTGTSTTHLRSMADEVVKQARTQGQPVIGEEGRLQAEWILVDLGAVIVHIMLARARALYSLEDLWNFDSSAAQLAATKTARDED
jgi:ribosome-associated protein